MITEGAALIYCGAGEVQAKHLGGAGSIHCHAGNAVLTLALCGQIPLARDRSSAAGRAVKIRCHAGTGRHSASPGIARFVWH